MAAVTTLQLVVDESGAAAGFARLERKSLDTFSKVTANVRKARTEMQGLANDAPKAGNAIADGMDKANSHALTSLDTVRLFRDDLGIRIPRAMEKLIASTAAFKVVAQAAFGAFAFVGVVELVGTIGSKISDWGHYLMGDTKAVQEFRKALEEANDTAILSPKNTDQARKSLQLLNSEITRLEARRDQSTLDKLGNQALFGGTKNLQDKDHFFSDEDEKRLIKDTQMREEAIKNLGVLAKQVNEQTRRSDEETAAAAAEGFRKFGVERKNAKSEIDAKVYTRELSPAEATRLKLDVDKKYNVDVVNLTRETAKQTTEIWQQATLANLKGEERARQASLYEEQNYAREASRRGDPDVKSHTAAMEAKYQADKLERLRQFEDETSKIVEQANATEEDGTKRLRVEEENSLAELLKMRIQRGEQGLEYDQAYSDRRFAIVQQTDAKILQSTKQYLDQERSAHDSILSSSSHGYAEIAAQRQRQLDGAKQSYEKVSGGLDPNSQEKQDVDAAYAQHKVDIETETNQKIAELNRKNNNDTLQLQDEALSVRSGRQRDGLLGIFHEEQQQTARIMAEYDKRERALKEKVDDNLISSKDAAAQQLAIEDLKNNQLAEQQRGFQDRIAGTLESAFRDPMATIKSSLEHEFAELLANWLLQLTIFKGAFGSTMSGLGISGPNAGGSGPASTLSSVLGGVMSHRTSSRPDGLPDFAPSGSRIGADGAPISPHTFTSSVSTLQSIGGLPGYDVAATNTPPTFSSSSSTSSIASNASALPGFSVTGSANAPSYGSYDQAPTGEDGGFAGYMTGGTDDMSLTAAGRDDAQYLNPIGSAATGQAAADDASSLSGGVSSVLGYAGAALGAYSSINTTVNAYKSGNILQGAMGDAAAGAAIGSIVPGVGTAIGAGVGALIGGGSALVGMIGGEGSKLAARDYYKNSIFPELEHDYNDPSTDFQTAISNANKTAADGLYYMRGKYGNDAAQWVDQNYLAKELTRVTSRISDTATGGRMYTTLSAAQFHSGTSGISDFGDLWTSSTEGFVHAELGEGVVNSMAMGMHRPIVGAMNSGASPSEIASMYLGGSSRTTQPPASSGGDNHYHIHTLDTKTMKSWLRDGGAQMITKHQNDQAAKYAGDGING